jgi:hypothetical protein
MGNHLDFSYIFQPQIMLQIQPMKKIGAVHSCSRPTMKALQLQPPASQREENIVPKPGRIMFTRKKMRPHSPGHF